RTARGGGLGDEAPIAHGRAIVSDGAQRGPGCSDAARRMSMRVEFESEGETVVGELHGPEAGGRCPAAVLLGPLTSVKEQARGCYAQALARRGWAALSFDPRYFGESGGQ